MNLVSENNALPKQTHQAERSTIFSTPAESQHSQLHNSRFNTCQDSTIICSERIEYSDDKAGIRVGDSNFRHFRAKSLVFGEFSTTQYLPVESRVRIENAPVVIASFHGLNATVSHAGSGLALINDFVSNYGFYAETIDQPGCGNNSEFSVLNSLETILDFYTSYLEDLKKRAVGKPLVVTGFCYSSGFLVEVNKRNPGLIDGMVLSGLVIPDSEIGLDFSIAVESRMYADGLIKENPAVRVRADRIYANLKWTHDDNPFGSTKTLILIGEDDPFMSEGARLLFGKWATSSKLIRYMEIEGAGHGVLGPIKNSPQSTELVRQNVVALIKEIINSTCQLQE